ncbi:DUF805 domain-containing protein [Salinibacterium sp. dk2585]|uniref:DUF805 domain-containing protein n=1 Tax=unclassified Salinibacterium TaxID=2632331 RepID=UPI0011C2475F|nr:MULTISPECIES: DUF805 domain-containing protein [unclassified Salinibacterium]QEE62008.1 DUF805 domain-containing protein [Salinibacterium sp. dk2585]TXK54437.1 DUF805 domain-containing protein [Salinibacterium sp. dk5596]
MTYATGILADSPPASGASLPTAMARFVRDAFLLRGRASRSEYWWWMLVNILVVGTCLFAVPLLVAGSAPQPSLRVGPFGSGFFADLTVFTTSATGPSESAVVAGFAILGAAWVLFTLVPGVTVAVRRLHDSNLSGAWALLALIPAGGLILLALMLRRSSWEGARFDA